jgi:hypothetical protein
MYDSEDVLEAARIIQPYLPDLLGSESDNVDRTLVDLLAKVESGEAVDNQILEFLAERDATREWTRQFLIDKMPPPVMRSYDPLAGPVSQIDANAFACPEPNCNYVWYRPKAGIEAPMCPNHQISLMPAQSQTT